MTKANNSVSLLAMIDPSGGLDSCWPYIGKRWHKDGYGYPKRNQKAMLAHRWSYEHHYGVVLIPTIIIRHTCDNPACCNPLHLLPGTQADNVQDAVNRNRLRSNPKRMFTQEQLEEFKTLRATGFSQQKIADLNQCSQVTISYWELRNWKISHSDLTGGLARSS
jgi:hypothetical protein